MKLLDLKKLDVFSNQSAERIFSEVDTGILDTENRGVLVVPLNNFHLKFDFEDQTDFKNLKRQVKQQWVKDVNQYSY